MDDKILNGFSCSIVMPSFQQVAFLEEAVRSVLNQKGVKIELLVMDPGSTDGSRELLLKLKQEYGEQLKLHFKEDRGQSDAINRGMSLAQGHILGWLNSDDRLRSGALARVAEWLNSPEPRWIYGRAGMIDERGYPNASLIVRYKNWRGRKFSHFKLLTENFIPQMAVFWNRTMWEKAGGLHIEKHLDMDYDLWLRFARVTKPLVLQVELADFRIHRKAKGSVKPMEQLGGAFETAREHAVKLGFKGYLALLLHFLLSWRTRLLYRWLKPK